MTKLISTNPADGSRIGSVTVSTRNEIEKKVNEARKAAPEWAALGVKKRTALLRKMLAKLESKKDDIAEIGTREMGTPLALMKANVADSLNYLAWYFDNAEKYLGPDTTYEDAHVIHQVFREPLGVAAAIAPWNWPFANFVWSVGQNLAVGNTVVFKHSEETPLSGKIVEDIVCDVLPKGVFSEVYGGGDVGATLVDQNIDLINFTGSSKTGKKLYQKAAQKMIRIVMELGGSDPGIVFKDADLDSAIGQIEFARNVNCGQRCAALKRLIVDETIFDTVVSQLAARFNKIRIGDPMNPKTEMGPLVAMRQQKLLKTQVADAVKKGAQVVTGGNVPKGLTGSFFEPTILVGVNATMRVWNEEIFGPVLSVVPFRTEEEAIWLANDTEYGLGAYLYTGSKKRAKRVVPQIHAGMVSVNGVDYNRPCNPFGGYKQSGIGREHGGFGFHDLTQVKIVATEK